MGVVPGAPKTSMIAPNCGLPVESTTRPETPAFESAAVSDKTTKPMLRINRGKLCANRRYFRSITSAFLLLNHELRHCGRQILLRNQIAHLHGHLIATPFQT